MSFRISLALMTALSVAVFAACGSGEGKEDDGGSLNPLGPEVGVPGSVDANIAAGGADTSSEEPDTEVSDITFGDGSALPSPVDVGGTAVLVTNIPVVDLGAFDVGTNPRPVNVTVTNVGAAASGPLAVSVTNADLSVSGCDGQTLAPQSNCTISITAEPGATAGPISGTIEVEDTVGSGTTIAVSGLATTPGWMLTLSPASLDLGLLSQGQVASGTVFVTNPAFFVVTGIVLHVSGTGFDIGTGTCTDVLQAGETCYITINFTAGVTPGVFQGLLTVAYGGIIRAVPLTATVP